MKCFFYKKLHNHEYKLPRDYSILISIRPKTNIKTLHILLDTKGQLKIKKGFIWDGPSAPAIDTVDFMRGSLVHDALYKLIRDGHLKKTARKKADRILQRICLEDGMPKIRAFLVYYGLRLFGGFAV
ncbi:Protein of unknown function [Desulfocicer vacuolatum DSM 3385]|uniref:DUF1353 domain-containing protein n=1 Tax=Desulfocicer vacuolatum DSM 3385 TaxID=1121400 RepID=A0A1W2B958_9BACT|nr:DUF1353 domain-containing protein [Desulfocicer vacuolatum]SMC69553.1 Protein of unknown function [Desulfocicer vacuolatum DSM 3385]